MKAPTPRHGFRTSKASPILFIGTVTFITAGVSVATLMTPLPMQAVMIALGVDAEGVSGSWATGVFACNRLRFRSSVGLIELRNARARMDVEFDLKGIEVQVTEASAESASLQIARGFEAPSGGWVSRILSSLHLESASINSMDVAADESQFKFVGSSLQISGASVSDDGFIFKQILLTTPSMSVQVRQLVRAKDRWSPRGGLEIEMTPPFAPLFVKRELAISVREAGKPPVLTAQVTSEGARLPCESLGDAVSSDAEGDWLINRLVDELKILAWRACGERAKQQARLSVDARTILRSPSSDAPEVTPAPNVQEVFPVHVAEPVGD